MCASNDGFNVTESFLLLAGSFTVYVFFIAFTLVSCLKHHNTKGILGNSLTWTKVWSALVEGEHLVCTKDVMENNAEEAGTPSEGPRGASAILVQGL